MNHSFFGNIAGKNVCRLGYGAMRITGPGIWGPPSNEKEIISLLRLASESGIQHFDTADAYGPNVSEEIIKKAFYPYSEKLLIATKGGFTRGGPGEWQANGEPKYIRKCLEGSLLRLKLEAIDLYYLHRIDEEIPLYVQIHELSNMKKEGKIKNIGLSKVTLQQIKEADKIEKIAAIQNKFNRLYQTESHEIIKWCETKNIAFVPYAPFGIGKCLAGAKTDDILSKDSQRASAEISWLLNYSPNLFPIPSTTNLMHLEQNLKFIQQR